jgi:hypothetical protein
MTRDRPASRDRRATRARRTASQAGIASAIEREAWEEAALRVLIVAAAAMRQLDADIDDLLAALDPAGERRDASG